MALLSTCNVAVKKENIKNETPPQVSFRLEQAWMTDTVMRTPESVCYDSVRNQLYVSNINLGEKEESGFISKLSPDGKILDLKWIVGLKAPKGLAVSGNNLYVADVDELVEMRYRARHYN